MNGDELCSISDTILDYYVVPFVAFVVFIFMCHPLVVSWLENYVPSGVMLYLFGGVIVFLFVFLAEVTVKRWRETRSGVCLDRGNF